MPSEKRHSGELLLALPKQREGIFSVKDTTLVGIINTKGDEFIQLNLIHKKHCSEEEGERLAVGDEPGGDIRITLKTYKGAPENAF